MSSGLSVIQRAWPQLLDGFAFSVGLALFAAIGGLALGMAIAIVRLAAPRPIALLAWAYVTLFRCVPLLLVIFWFYLLMPIVLQRATGSRFPVAIGPVYSAMITFTVFEAAYYSEAIRAGINSLGHGQWDAARSLCLSPLDMYRDIILPQAIRRMLPVLVTQTIALFQDTSLVYVLTLPDFVGVASRLGEREGDLTFFYVFIALVFFVISFALSHMVRRLEFRDHAAQL